MEKQTNKFGFTPFAENWNGRLAMLGFVIAIAVELMTGKGILAQLGLM
ncbi:CAB/ELIP/HLIP superfamily protein [Stanieria sp. NIES-3757]|nr:CAB/ELIP/HLIP superfamily protein [Stanieria sp. NIES-3757]